MNLISEQVGFDYRLYFSPDGKYGTEGKDGHINGMIGEVFKNVSTWLISSSLPDLTKHLPPKQKADFAIADLTVTDSRRKFIDFTEPFLENQLSAIVRRDDAGTLRTLEDLVTANELHRSELIRGTHHQASLPTAGIIAYGTYRTGSTFFHLSRSRDPVAVRMYNWMLRHPGALVSSAKEGFDRVNAGRYAFIVESTFAEYLTGLYCNLTTLYDTRRLYSRQFAIALPKGSPHLGAFNAAIRELKASGAIERLRSLYWTNRCNQQQQQRTLAAENENREKPSVEPILPPPSSSSPTSTAESSSSVVTKMVDPIQPVPSITMTTSRRGGNSGGSESADDRTSGNRIEGVHPNIDWSAGGHHNNNNNNNHHSHPHHHHRPHQRVPVGNTRTLNPNGVDDNPSNNAFANSRYHHRNGAGQMTPVQQVASSSGTLKITTYLYCLLTTAILTRYLH